MKLVRKLIDYLHVVTGYLHLLTLLIVILAHGAHQSGRAQGERKGKKKIHWPCCSKKQVERGGEDDDDDDDDDEDGLACMLMKKRAEGDQWSETREERRRKNQQS